MLDWVCLLVLIWTSFLPVRDSSHTPFDSVQGFVHLVIDLLVGGLDECQRFGGQSEVSWRGDVLFFVSLVEIVEIGMRVGSCDENACNEKSDSCE